MDSAQKIRRLSLNDEIQGFREFVRVSLPHIADHCDRAAEIAPAFAQEVGFLKSDVALVEAAALLHDLGKFFIPRTTLFKPGVLTDSERTCMATHVTLMANYVGAHVGNERLAQIIMQHHERPDGRGYPYAIAGDQIDPVARVISIVDSFCAMTEKRPYGKPFTTASALKEIERFSGRQFDPELAAKFIEFAQHKDL
jgi:putative nucleotidyltransferase with HDIG domain